MFLGCRWTADRSGRLDQADAAGLGVDRVPHADLGDVVRDVTHGLVGWAAAGRPYNEAAGRSITGRAEGGIANG
jgi:hypothetical protein